MELLGWWRVVGYVGRPVMDDRACLTGGSTQRIRDIQRTNNAKTSFRIISTAGFPKERLNFADNTFMVI